MAQKFYIPQHLTKNKSEFNAFKSSLKNYIVKLNNIRGSLESTDARVIDLLNANGILIKNTTGCKDSLTELIDSLEQTLEIADNHT